MKRHGRSDRRQFLIDWTAAAVPATKPPATVPPADPPAPVQVLPWDFRATFPPVLDDAIDAGVIAEEDALPENLAALHAENAGQLLAALSDLDAVRDARRRGVDPATGKAPRSAAKKRELPTKLDREVNRLERWWLTLLDTYEAVFGAEAAEAFGKCVRARHAGVEVTADPRLVPVGVAPEMPVLEPLRRSVEAGVFGREEDGRPVDPGPEEVLAITRHHAEVLTDLVGEFRGVGQSPAVRKAVRKYAADFGREAADALLDYSRRRVVLDGPRRP